MGHRAQLILLQVGGHPVGPEIMLKISELPVDRFVPALLGGGHIGQLGKDQVPGLVQGVDGHVLPAVFVPLTPDPEVGVDQQQGLHGQILALQVPGGVVGGDVTDALQAVLPEPLPGVVIVEVGDALGLRPPAAELAQVVAEGRCPHQGEVHRQPSLAGQDGGVQGHVVHPDGVGSRVKGHKFPAQGEQGQNMLFLGRLEEALVVCRRGAVVQALRRKGEQVHQGVEGVRPVLEGQIQQG